MEREHRPLGEPADPEGGGGFVWISDTRFSLSHRNTREEAEFRYHNTPSLGKNSQAFVPIDVMFRSYPTKESSITDDAIRSNYQFRPTHP
jgi:hypothetical protein